MAIMKMKHITIVALQKNRKAIMEMLHKQGILQIDNVDNNELVHKDNTKSISQFDSYMNMCISALEKINKYVPKKKSLISKRDEIEISNYTISSLMQEETIKYCHDIELLQRKIEENQENIRRIDAKVNALVPYLKLNIPMKWDGTKNTVRIMGLLPGEWCGERLAQSLSEIESAQYEILSGDKSQTCIWLAALKSDAKKINKWKKEVGLSEPQFSLSHRTPSDKTNILKEARKKLKDEITEYEKRIADYSDKRDDIELFYDYLELRRDKYKAIEKLAMTRNTFIIDGWIAEDDEEEMLKALSKFDVYAEIRAPHDDEEPPIKFKNSSITAPVEGITETYAMPSKIDIDPNPIMAIFYYVFFGMMFSDAGYGLIMMIACAILGFTRLLEEEKRKSFKMFFWCGVSTTFWGIMYGSFFGDAIDKIAHTFFNVPESVEILKPLWINPQKEALLLLIVSIAFGMVQILVGLGIKFHMNWRQGLYSDALFDIGFWMIILIGACVLGVGMGFQIDKMFSIGIGLMTAGAVGVVLTGGRKKKGVGKIVGGVVGLYDITSYVSDALSYSRLMALGLATGVIAQVVNILGTMKGNSVVGIVMFIVIFILGHAINFALNVLGAYVHTNRLQYVEFYSKFYEGGGERFKPFKIQTKYHKFVGELQGAKAQKGRN